MTIADPEAWSLRYSYNITYNVCLRWKAHITAYVYFMDMNYGEYIYL